MMRRLNIIRGLAAAALAGLALAACVPVGAPPQTSQPFARAPGSGDGPGFGPGPGLGGGASNGLWITPAISGSGSPWNSNQGGFSMHNIEAYQTSTSLFLYAVYDDGTGLSWGTLSYPSARWQGYWIRANGAVACPVPLQPPGELTGIGFQFLQPAYTWGTFDVVLSEGQGSINGTWGGCGVPIGGPWTGTVAWGQ